MNNSNVSNQIQILFNQFKVRNFELVISKAKQLIKRHPEYVILYNLVGSANQNLGNHIEAENYFKKGLKLDPNNLRDSLEDCTTIGEITGTVFQQYSQTRHKPRWGDKRPYYIRYIPQLLKLYPDARIIHIIRNGHDCISSLKRMPWWNKNIVYSMLAWRYSIRMGAKAAEAYKDQFLEVRYEDVVRHPETQLKNICDFINVKYEPGMLEFHLSAEKNIPDYKIEWHHKTFKPLSDDAIDTGKEQLSDNELKLFSWCAGKELNLWNYEANKRILSFSLKYFRQWVEFYSNIFLERAIDRLIDVFYFYPISYKNKD